MRALGIITVGTVIVLTLFSTAQAQSEQDATQPNKPRQRREPVKVVDLAPETATHVESEPLKVEFKRLTALRIGRDDSLLACDGDAKLIKMISSSGEPMGAIELPFAPEALDMAADGTLYCGGEGQLVKLDSDGRILKTESVPDDVTPGATATQASSADGTSARNVAAANRVPRRSQGSP